MRRLILIALVALGLAPGTWVRSPLTSTTEPVLTIVRLDVAPRSLGDLRFLGAWRLSSPNDHFGGYSALVPLGDGRLLAGSDRGRMLLFSPPGMPMTAPVFDHFAGQPHEGKRQSDLEALARDPGTGRLWAAYEFDHRIERLEADFSGRGTVRPGAMQGWPDNGGAEAMARLSDGRFIVLAEANPEWFGSASPGLVFPGDPVEGGKPAEFRFVAPGGLSPTDMAQLPDGRVLILLRRVRWGLPPRFEVKLALADPARLTAGGEWRAEAVADLTQDLPGDNYEGLAIEPQADGSAVVWVISDDNRAVFQRTLLLKLLWGPTKKARESLARPSEFR